MILRATYVQRPRNRSALTLVTLLSLLLTPITPAISKFVGPKRRSGASNARASERSESDSRIATAKSVNRSPALLAPTATKTDALITDVNNNNQADPGDTLRYTITITNTGSTDINTVAFSDTIDANTTLVPGSIQTTPLARDDNYNTVGNVQLTVPIGSGLLSNDTDPAGSGPTTVSTSPTTSANGGNVSVAADGSFTYNPAPGFSGSDSFSYTINDGEGNLDSATVNITVGQVVWFINNSVGGPGDGRFTSPFSSIANFNSSAADDAGDYIFIYQGSGAYSGALTLLNNQQLIGHGVGLTISPNLAIAAASRPTISNLTLGSGNTVSGLNINVSSGNAIIGASVGALTINNVSVTSTATGSGSTAVTISGGNSSMAVTFDSVSATGSTNGISLTGNAGTFAVNGGTIQNTTGHGISLSNSTAGPLNFTLQNSTVSNVGSTATVNGINLDVPSGGSGSFGTVTVKSNTISNHGNATGLLASIQGTGSIGKIDVGSNTFTGNNVGVNLTTNGTASIDFDIHNNATISGNLTQVNIAANDVSPNIGSGPTMEGYIRNNTITASPSSLNSAVRVISFGDGNISADINNNSITNFGDTGIDVESRGGTGDVAARIANNTASTTASLPFAAMYLRSGDGTSGETSLLCVNVSSNNMNGGSGVADYILDRFNPATTLFQIQGLSPAAATPAQAEAFIISTDSAPPATAFAAAGTYTAATCSTVSFASLLKQRPLFAKRLPANEKTFGFNDVRHSRKHHAASNSISSVPSRADVKFEAPTPVEPKPHSLRAAPALMSGETINVSLGIMNPNQQVVITFDVTINNSLPSGVTQVSNQGSVSGSFSPPPVLTDDPDTATPNDPTVTPVNNAGVSPDLTISKTHSGNFTQGQIGAQYTITVTNSGSGPTSGTVSVVDTLPAGLTATALNGTGWSCTLGTLTCTRSDALGNSSSYQNITLTVNVASNAPASVTNSVAVSGGNESNTGNNTATNPTTINAVASGSADLEVEKSDSPDPVLLGNNITYKVEVKNDGPRNATGVVITDTLPASVTFVSASLSCTYNSGPHTVTCNIGNLAEDSEVRRTIVVKTTATGTITNTVTVAGNQTDPQLSDNTDTSQTKVVIGIQSLTLNPNRIKGGSNVIGTVTLSAPAAVNTLVNLSSSNTSVAKPTVSSITIAAGQTTGSFTVKTFRVSSDRTVRIKATANGTSKEATLTVKD